MLKKILAICISKYWCLCAGSFCHNIKNTNLSAVKHHQC